MGEEEKRRHPRVTITSIARVTLADQGEGFDAYVGGISRGGLEIYCERVLSAGMRLAVEIRFINEQGRQECETVAGCVRWSSVFSRARVAGIEFDTIIGVDDHPALNAYLTRSESFFRKGV